MEAVEETQKQNELSEPLITAVEAARRLAIKPATLEKWRVQKRGPAYVRVGQLARYRPSEIAAFIERNTVKPAASE